MDYKKKMNAFNKRFTIISDSTYQDEFFNFKTRILNIFQDIDKSVSADGILKFCQVLGLPNREKVILNKLKIENDEKEFYRVLQLITYLPIRSSMNFQHETIYNWEIMTRELKEAIDLSNINLSIAKKDREIVLYPRGQKELDDQLVEKTFNFLNPEAQIHFEEALKFYQKFSARNAIKSAESLRRCLEEFLRFKLHREANTPELLKYLKKGGNDPMIRNIISNVFNFLDKYFNENGKHKDGEISEAENEFLIYQTGLLLRYIDKTIK